MLQIKKMVGGIFGDLQKPSNCVNYKILLSKLEFYGITAMFHNLINSSLADLYQKVHISFNIYNNNTSSDWCKIAHGVLQWSVSQTLIVFYIF